MVTVPATPVVAMLPALGPLERLFVIWTDEDGLEVAGETISEIVARLPLPIGVVFSPQTIHESIPGPTLLQESDLLALVAMAPAVTVAVEKSVGE